MIFPQLQRRGCHHEGFGFSRGAMLLYTFHRRISISHQSIHTDCQSDSSWLAEAQEYRADTQAFRGARWTAGRELAMGTGSARQSVSGAELPIKYGRTVREMRACG